MNGGNFLPNCFVTYVKIRRFAARHACIGEKVTGTTRKAFTSAEEFQRSLFKGANRFSINTLLMTFPSCTEKAM